MPADGQNLGLFGISRGGGFFEVGDGRYGLLIDLFNDIALLEVSRPHAGIHIRYHDAVNSVREIEIASELRC
jgi:hypothetical protein